MSSFGDARRAIFVDTLRNALKPLEPAVPSASYNVTLKASAEPRGLAAVDCMCVITAPNPFIRDLAETMKASVLTGELARALRAALGLSLGDVSYNPMDRKGGFAVIEAVLALTDPKSAPLSPPPASTTAAPRGKKAVLSDQEVAIIAIAAGSAVLLVAATVLYRIHRRRVLVTWALADPMADGRFGLNAIGGKMWV